MAKRTAKVVRETIDVAQLESILEDMDSIVGAVCRTHKIPVGVLTIRESSMDAEVGVYVDNLRDKFVPLLEVVAGNDRLWDALRRFIRVWNVGAVDIYMTHGEEMVHDNKWSKAIQACVREVKKDKIAEIYSVR